jgi:phosphatidylethanolamine/phosphatidyl-N-methylethanolamine N-methyltransferase
MNFNSEKWYTANYNRVNASAIKNSIPNKILHRLIEKPFKSNQDLDLLEVGSNIGEHLNFVTPNFATYLMTDIRPVGVNYGDNLKNHRIKFEIADVQNLQYQDQSFDRVIATCLFHHLQEPLVAFREIRRVTKIGGTLSILIPNDPGALYRTLRYLTTLRNAKKLGIKSEANLNHALEHRNHYLQLRVLLQHVFKSDEVKIHYFPFRIKGYDLNALTSFQIERKC